MSYLKLFCLCFVVFMILDILWLGFIAKDFYYKEYSQWLRLRNGQLFPAWWAAMIIYIFLALAMVVFVFPLAHGNLRYVLIYSALMGLLIYGVYDFTCLAVFKNWPLLISLIDWIWGAIIFSAVGFCGYYFDTID